MTRHAVPMLALAVLLLFTARSSAERPETKPSYSNADLRIRLDSPADYPLAIRTTGFSDHLDGTLCEFMQGSSNVPLVGITGVIVHHSSDQPIADYAAAREKELSSLKNVTEFSAVGSKKLDRRPGEWIQREYRAVNFGTTFRYFAVYVADGKDRYALIVYGNAREDEKMLSDSAASVIAVFSVGGAPPPIVVATKPSLTTRPTTRLYATTAAANDAKRVFAIAKPTPLPAFPKIEPYRPSATTKPATQPTGDCFIICCKLSGAYVLYMTKSDGVLKEIGRFTAPEFMDDYPVFSANGKRCAVATSGTKGKILLSNLDGKESVAIVDGLFPCLSPDGSKLAYLSSTHLWEVYTLDLDKGGQSVRRQGPKANTSDSMYMAWSYDSKTLYFAGDFSDAAGFTPSSLYRLNATGQTKIWELPDRRLIHDIKPSPDGKTALVYCMTTTSQSEIYLVKTDGSGGKKILDGFYTPAGAWSEDGKRIFAASRDKLISCNPDGTDPRQLLQGNYNFIHWTPGGDHALVLGPTPGGGQGLFICGIDGSKPVGLNKIAATVLKATWCGDGKTTEIDKPVDKPADGDFVLKGGKYQIKFPSFPGDDMIAKMNKAGWEISGGTVTRKYKTRIGEIGAEKDVTYNGTLNFTGPPDVLKPGKGFDLSMSLTGDWQAKMEGQWRLDIPYDKHEGVELVRLSKPGTADAPPAGGNVKVTMLVKDVFQRKHATIALTLMPDFEIVWEYERK